MMEKPPNREIGYKVNVSLDGTPIYIYPEKAEEWYISMQKGRFKEKGLYYLFDKGELVYIGISLRNVYERLLDHFKDKIFDSYFIWTTIDAEGNTNEELLKKSAKAERLLIEKFKPKYNSLTEIALKEAKQKKH